MRVSHLADRLPAQLSGGERQRVAIARCLAMEPDALLLDEPFSALDPHLRRTTEEHLRETLRAFNGVVLFVTHDMEEAFRFCHELLVLDRGTIIAFGPRQQLFRDPGRVVAARLTGCKNIAAASQQAEDRLHIKAWDVSLKLERPVDETICFVGYRSHQFAFQQKAGKENSFPCWLVDSSEAPHEMTLYLRLHHPPQPGEPHHLQADLPKELWRELQDQPQPWTIQFLPERILPLAE